MKPAAVLLLLFAQVPVSVPFEGHVIRLHWLTTWEIEAFSEGDWLVISVVTAANDGQPVYYPPLPLIRAFGGAECPVQLHAYADALRGCQRAGEQTAHTYAVIETTSLEDNFQARCELPYDLWSSLRFEQAVVGEYRVNEHEIMCESLEF